MFKTYFYTLCMGLYFLVLYHCLISSDFPLYSAKGFCNYEAVETRLGRYNWPETAVDQSVTLPCFYNQLLGEEGNYTRICFSRSDWRDFNSTSCISKVTYSLKIIANVSLPISLH